MRRTAGIVLALMLLLAAMAPASAQDARESAYAQAISLADAGRLDQALTAFLALDGYRDSGLYAAYLRGRLLLDAQDPGEAAYYFEVLKGRGFLDSAQWSDYCQARLLEEAGDWRQALSLYERLDVGDSLTRHGELLRREDPAKLQDQALDVTLQLRLADQFYHGAGVVQDYAQAVYWYGLAAAKGNARAQCNLGEMYNRGLGVEEDEAEAFRLFTLSAQQGYALAQCQLGMCYENGWGTPPDPSKAFDCYSLAADQGDSDGQLMMYYCYKDGIGVAPDMAQAIQWVKLSADQGNAIAQYHLGYAYELGHVTGQPEPEVAFDWYMRSAQQGYLGAATTVGTSYLSGIGVEADSAEAVKWLTIAAEQGFAYAQYVLGICYRNGEGVEQDEQQAQMWLDLAAQQGITEEVFNDG